MSPLERGRNVGGDSQPDQKTPSRQIKTLSAQSSGLAIRSRSGSKLKFQTGWGQNFILEAARR